MPDDSEILPGEDAASIDRAAAVLREGGLVAMPTETVYGLAANALDAGAVAKVFAVKGRPSFDPLIVHVPDTRAARRYAQFDVLASRLADAFWPGPLTLVLPRRRGADGDPIVPDLVTAGLDGVGIRVPAHPVAQALLRGCGLPLAAPSANRFGSISPTDALHVASELGGAVGVILDGGPCESGVESTVVRVRDGAPEVLRLGALAVERIERAAGVEVAVRPPSSAPGEPALPAPGLTDRHYAPGTPMRLAASPASIEAGARKGRVGLLGLGDLSGIHGFAAVRSLSATSDLTEAAANLFRTLRELDAMGLDAIVALPVPDQGIGRAINDRLRRGSARAE